MTMIDIGLKIAKSKKKTQAECFDRQCKIAVEKFKSCTVVPRQYIYHFLCELEIYCLKSGKTLF